MSKNNRTTAILLLISIACFVICLPLHAFSAHKDPGVSSWAILLFGWTEVLSVPRVSWLVALSWYANPILFFAWIALALRSYRIASLFGAIAAFLSLSFLLAQKVAMNSSVTDTVTSYGPGYCFWVASALAAFASALMGRFKEPALPPRNAYLAKWRHDAVVMALLILLGMYSTYGPTIDWSIQHDLKFHNVAVFEKCSPPSLTDDISKGRRGDRAFLSDDGLSAVLQCADGSIKSWQAAKPAISNLGEMTLFSAAQRAGILRADLRCPKVPTPVAMCRTGTDVMPSSFPVCQQSDAFKGEGDCDVIDRTDDGAAFILRDVDAGATFVTTPGSQTSWAFDVFQHPGVLMPRSGAVKNVLYANKYWNFDSVSLDNAEVRHVFNFPIRQSIFGVDETPDAVAYSPEHQLLIISFGGAFIGSHNMAYIRAYSLEGMEQWNISGNAPVGEGGFSADYAHVKLFANGRYATFAKSKPASPFEIIEVANGDVIGSASGVPIATSAKTSRMIIKSAEGKYTLEEWESPNP